jgi:hypothetical protein
LTKLHSTVILVLTIRLLWFLLRRSSTQSRLVADKGSKRSLPGAPPLGKHDHEALLPSTCGKAGLCEGLSLRPWPARARHLLETA